MFWGVTCVNILCRILLACLLLVTGCSKTSISWVDVVKLDNIKYLATSNWLDEKDLGPQIGTVNFTVSGNVNNSNYKLKNGDSTFIPVGTPIFSLKNYLSKFRVAVESEGRFRVYESNLIANATRGSDYLDISNKVEFIGINDERDNSEIAKIKDKQQVEHLTKLVMEASITKSEPDRTNKRYFISFHLIDGTAVTGAYWLESGQFSHGIILPSEFRSAVEQALSIEDK